MPQLLSLPTPYKTVHAPHERARLTQRRSQNKNQPKIRTSKAKIKKKEYLFHGVIFYVKVLVAISGKEEMFSKWKLLWQDILSEY